MLLVERLFYFDVLDPAGLTIVLLKAAYMRANVDVVCFISGVEMCWAKLGTVPARKYAVTKTASPQNCKTKINHNYPVSITFEHTTKCVID